MNATDMSERTLHEELNRVAKRYRRLLLWSGLAVLWLALAMAGAFALIWARGAGRALPGVLLALWALLGVWRQGGALLAAEREQS